MSDNKQKIISDVYYDRSGYGSRKTTLEDSKKKEPTIKIADVEGFFRKNIEIKKKPRGENSFAARTTIILIKLIYLLFQKRI